MWALQGVIFLTNEQRAFFYYALKYLGITHIITLTKLSLNIATDNICLLFHGSFPLLLQGGYVHIHKYAEINWDKQNVVINNNWGIVNSI